MGDHEQFSDDISDLWGPSDTGVLEPAPLRKPEPEPANGLTNGATAPNGAVHETPPAVDQRLAALERELRALADKVGRDHTEPVTRGDLDALRTDLEVNLGQEVAQARRDLLAQLDLRVSESHARNQEHVREATAQVVERLSVLDQDLRHAVAKVAAAMDAHEYEPVGKHRARTLHHELQQEFAAQLAAARHETEAAVEARIARAEAEFSRRLDALPAQVADAAGDRVAQTEQRTARLAESIDGVRAETAAALAEAMATTRSEMATTAERLAEAEDTTARLAETIASVRSEAHTATERATQSGHDAAQLRQTVEALSNEAVRRPELDDVQEALATRAEDRLEERLATTIAESSAALRSEVHEAVAAVEHSHTSQAAAHSDLLARLEQRLIQLTELVDTYRAQAVATRQLQALRAELEATLADQLAAVRSELAAAAATPTPTPTPNTNGGRARHLWSRHHAAPGS